MNLHKKIEPRVDELRKACLASLVGDNNYFKVDNHLCLTCVVIHASSKQPQANDTCFERRSMVNVVINARK